MNGITNAELCKWMSIQSCLSLLVDVKKSSDRVGPLVVLGLINDSAQSSEKVNTALQYQVCWMHFCKKHILEL